MSKVPGTIKNAELTFQRELLARLEVLDVQPGQVLLLEMPRSFFSEKKQEEHQMVTAFAEALGKATGGRDVFLVPEGTIKAVDDPRPQQKQPPDIAIARAQIVLPSGVKL